MRWTLRISFLLFLAWAIFIVSPFVALYDLAKSVEAKDVARITARVNLDAIGTSLSRQLLGDYLKQQDLGGIERQIPASAFNPFIQDLITPEALIDLLEDGLPQQTGGGSPLFQVAGGSLRTSVSDAWRVFIASESHGFRSITIPLPARAAEKDRFKLTMRLSGTTWRLTGIDLPEHLREELSKRAMAAVKRSS